MVFKMVNIRLFFIFIITYQSWAVSSHVSSEPSVNESNAVLAASILFPTLPIVVLGSANEQCRTDSQLLLDNLRNSTTWAAQMFDASAKSVEGVLYGGLYQFGNFDECVGTVTPIQGQYCLATLTLHPPKSVPINPSADIYDPLGSVWDKIGHEGDKAKVPRNVVYNALCVPASCSHDDVQRHLTASTRNHSISVEVHPDHCQTNRQSEKFSNGAVAYCIVMAAIMLLVILSTVCDRRTYSSVSGYEQSNNKLDGQDNDGYLLSFSLKKNLFEIGKDAKKSIGCLNGMRFISTCFVINAHRILLQIIRPIYNYEFLERTKTTFVLGFVYQLEAVVDTFFLLSGILVTYVLLNVLQKRRVNLFQVIMYRYLRLTPVYAVVVFFYITIFYYTGHGPLWTAAIGSEQQFCQENWWTNLLYVNNYVNEDRMCMLHSWYLAADFHLFIVSTLLVLLLHYHPRAGYIALSLTTAASLIIPFTITYFKHLDPVQFFYNDEVKLVRAQPYFKQMYIKTHVHATPSLVGIAVGLIFFRLKSHQRKYTWQTTIGVVAGFLISFGSLVPGALMTSKSWNYNDIHAALEQPQRRLLWPLGMGLVLISLAFSKNSILNKALSCRMMVCLSKLTYSAYLVSLCYQIMQDASSVGPRQISNMEIITDSLSDIISSFAIAFVLYLMVEAPFENIVAKFFKKERKETVPKAEA